MSSHVAISAAIPSVADVVSWTNSFVMLESVPLLPLITPVVGSVSLVFVLQA